MKECWQESDKGFTVYVTVGKWSKPKLHYVPSRRSVRLCLGFIAVSIGFFDIETFIGNRHRYIIHKK